MQLDNSLSPASKIIRCMRDSADLRRKHTDISDILREISGDVVEVIFFESSATFGDRVIGAKDLKSERIVGKSVDDLAAEFSQYLKKNDVMTLSLMDVVIDGNRVLFYHFRPEL